MKFVFFFYIIVYVLHTNIYATNWTCTEVASEKIDNFIMACGVGEAETEGDARKLALENAINEFKSICNISDDCLNKKTYTKPLRNSCEKLDNNKIKCYRGIQVEFREEKNQEIKQNNIKNKEDENKEDKNLQLEIEIEKYKKELEQEEKNQKKQTELEELKKQLETEKFKTQNLKQINKQSKNSYNILLSAGLLNLNVDKDINILNRYEKFTLYGLALNTEIIFNKRIALMLAFSNATSDTSESTSTTKLIRQAEEKFTTRIDKEKQEIKYRSYDIIAKVYPFKGAFFLESGLMFRYFELQNSNIMKKEVKSEKKSETSFIFGLGWNIRFSYFLIGTEMALMQNFYYWKILNLGISF